MEDAKYVLKTHERVFVPEETSRFHTFMRWFVWVVVGIIIVGSLVFQDNIFTEMSWSARVLLVVLVFTFGFQKKVPTPSEIEIWFYDDYLVVYRDKRYYDKRCTYREHNKFYYDDISSMDYDYKTNRFNIHGKIDATYFKYDKYGNVSNESEHKVTDGGICWFYVIDNDEEDIISTMVKYVVKLVIRMNEKEV